MTRRAATSAARATKPDLTFERDAWAAGARLVAGLDEVGRGALAGPVVAAAVILDPACVPDGLDDSKRLSAARLRRPSGYMSTCRGNRSPASASWRKISG